MVDKYLSVKEVAEKLAVNHKTIRCLVSSGQLPAVKIGGLIRVAERELINFLGRSAVSSQKFIHVKAHAPVAKHGKRPFKFL